MARDARDAHVKNGARGATSAGDLETCDCLTCAKWQCNDGYLFFCFFFLFLRKWMVT